MTCFHRVVWLRLAWALLLPPCCATAVASPPTSIAYRCRQGDAVTYTDTACDDGIAVASWDLRQPATLKADGSAERQRAATEKSTLRELESARHREEMIAEKQARRARAAAANRQKKCTALALRKKWLEQDAAIAPYSTSHSARKARNHARFLADRYVLECGTGSP